MDIIMKTVYLKSQGYLWNNPSSNQIEKMVSRRLVVYNLNKCDVEIKMFRFISYYFSRDP